MSDHGFSVHVDVLEETLDTYTLEIVRDRWALARPHADEILNALLEVEENLTDLLPEGVHARIKPWNKE